LGRINRGQDRLYFRPIQNPLSVVQRMKAGMIKIIGGHKKLGLRDEWLLHELSYQIF
jgi:hypothetical protein